LLSSGVDADVGVRAHRRGSGRKRNRLLRVGTDIRGESRSRRSAALNGQISQPQRTDHVVRAGNTIASRFVSLLP